jgi:hypothetical protein
MTQRAVHDTNNGHEGPIKGEKRIGAQMQGKLHLFPERLTISPFISLSLPLFLSSCICNSQPSKDATEELRLYCPLPLLVPQLQKGKNDPVWDQKLVIDNPVIYQSEETDRDTHNLVTSPKISTPWFHLSSQEAEEAHGTEALL